MNELVNGKPTTEVNGKQGTEELVSAEEKTEGTGERRTEELVNAKVRTDELVSGGQTTEGLVNGNQTTEERYALGKETLICMVGEAGAEKIEDIRRYFPEFGQLLVAFGFGDLYSRSVFDLKQREIITLTSLITQGATEQLPFHVHAALNVGLTPDEILEIVRHCAGYAGFPKACGALDVVRRVFAERGVAGA